MPQRSHTRHHRAMAPLPEDVRERMTALRTHADALLLQEPAPPLQRLIASALDDLVHAELLFEPETLREALVVPAAKLWRVAKTLELVGPLAQHVPNDLADFDVLPGIAIRPPRG